MMVIELHGKSGPAVADNPDLVDTKLSIALSSVIHQAGESARDVAMQRGKGHKPLGEGQVL